VPGYGLINVRYRHPYPYPLARWNSLLIKKKEDKVPEKVTYYAVVGENRTIENPSGLVRRRHAVGGPVDESLARDLSWSFTDAIYQLERGENFGPELVEISEDEAAVLMERFRQRWEGAS
jgi:hypothetical protein